MTAFLNRKNRSSTRPHPLVLTTASRTPAGARASHGGRRAGEGSGLSEELLAREIAGEQAFVDRVYVQLEKSATAAQLLAREGHEPRAARPRGWPGRARRHGVPGGEADRPARRRPRGPGVRPPRPAGRARRRPALHRPDRPARRRPRLAADRLARARGRRVLPGHRRRPAERRTPPRAALRRPDGRRRRGRAARRRGRDRPADRRRGRPDGAALPRPRPVDALDRGHHPGRAGPGDPGARRAAWRRSPAAPAPARRSWRCTARRTCSTPTGVATRPAACSSSARAASSCATSSGCCRRSARRPSRCGRWARSSTGVRATRHDEPAVADVKGSARMAELMRRTSRQQAPGLAAGVPDLLARRRDPARPREARQAAPPADGPGPAQPPAPADRLVAARRDVAAGARRARSRARPRGVQRRDAVEPRRSSTSRSRGGRRSDAPRCSGWLRDPEFLARVGRGACCPPRSSGCCRSPGPAETTPSVEDVPLVDELRYALGDVPDRARRRTTSSTTSSAATSQELTTAVGAGVRLGRPPAGRRRPTASRTTATPTCSSTRRRTSRRCSGGWSAAAAAPPPGRSSATRPSRRGRCRPSQPPRVPPRSRARSSTSSTSRPTTATPPRSTRYAAAYAERVGLDADLPTAVRSTGCRAARGRRRRRPRGRDARGRAPRSPARSRGTVGVVVPVARRSEVNAWLASWPELADDAPSARAAIDSSVTPSGDDRIVVLTGLDTKGLEFDGIVVVRPSRDRGRVRHRHAPPSTSSSPAPPSSSPSSPEARSGVVQCDSVVHPGSLTTRTGLDYPTSTWTQERQSRSAAPVRTRYASTSLGRRSPRWVSRGSRRATRVAGTWRGRGRCACGRRPAGAGQVAADDLEELQAVVAEPLLPLDVLAVTLRRPCGPRPGTRRPGRPPRPGGRGSR